MELNAVIKTIRDLANKTIDKGCTEAEAMSAAKKVGELMQVYNLSMDKVFLENSECLTLSIDTGRRKANAIGSCVVAIGSFCDCRVWQDRRDGSVVYKFFGLEPDTMMAKYLYEVVDAALEAETRRFKVSDLYVNPASNGGWSTPHRKTLSSSFQRGMTIRVSERLKEMTIERHRAEKEATRALPIFASTGTSIVLVKKNKVEEEFKKLSLRLKSGAASRLAGNVNAFNAGKSAGDRVNLQRPVGHSGGQRYLTG